MKSTKCDMYEYIHKRISPNSYCFLPTTVQNVAYKWGFDSGTYYRHLCYRKIPVIYQYTFIKMFMIDFRNQEIMNISKAYK